MVAFRLPLPTSTNDLVRPAFMNSLRCEACGHLPTKRPLVRLVKTKEANAFLDRAHRCLPVDPISGPIEVYVTLFFGTISSDIDNRLKSLFDAMKGRLFHDDIQIAELHVFKVVTADESKHGVVVEVRRANPNEHVELARRLAQSHSQQHAEESRNQLTIDDPIERLKQRASVAVVPYRKDGAP